jgi:hypothetical protein
MTATDVLGAAATLAEVRNARNAMLIYLADCATGRMLALPEQFRPWLTVSVALVSGAVFTLGVIASVVQVVTAQMSPLLVLGIWAAILVGGIVAGWHRWVQVSADDDGQGHDQEHST